MLTLPVLMAAVACSTDTSKAASDSALDRDLTLAGASAPAPAVLPAGDTANAVPRPAPQTGRTEKPKSPVRASPRVSIAPPQPARSATPAVVPAPASPVAAPSPAPGIDAPVAAAPAMKSIASGTMLTAVTTSQLCSLANRPGDKIVANLTSEVVGPDGARLPVGTPVLVEMAAAEPPADFAFRVRGVQINGQLIPVDGRVSADSKTDDRRVSKGGDKGKVATGAVIGAILGRVLGGGMKGTVIGAAGGAAAGSVAAARNSMVEHCLPTGALITVTLTSPLVYPAPAQ